MNNKFGSNGQYRDVREPFWRGTAGDRALQSPDQQFETSTNYREPTDPASSGVARYDQHGRGTAQSSRNSRGFSGRGPKGYARADERIREDVCERLRWNDELDATEISVRVENGEVILEGSVESRDMKRLAGDLAERVPGVTDVHNTVRVAKPTLTDLKESLAGSPERAHHGSAAKTASVDRSS
jgi:osmotically-inducible protein OsmY